MPIKITEQDGERLIVIDHPAWYAKIVLTNNANMICLRHIPSGLELLRTPLSLEELRRTPERYGMPLLFPPGRIEGGCFRWNGQDYSFPLNSNDSNLHGFLLGRPWALAETRERDGELMVAMIYEHGKSQPNFAGFPHEFRLTLIYRFTAVGVIQKTGLTNLSHKPMPFGLGYHTAFRLPFGPYSIEAEQRCRVMVTTGDGRWEMSPERRVPTGRLLPLAADERYNCGQAVKAILPGRLYPAVSQMPDGRKFRGSIIESPADHARLIYEVSDEYHLWALWNDGGGKGFFCVEPLTWMSNAPNLNLPPETTGLRVLGSGSSRSIQASIQLIG
ncbi:MAG: aldose 1-epimerase [Victivallales bacterium]|nr:aldose 1-epimerase [Victivallales bacterium]